MNDAVNATAPAAPGPETPPAPPHVYAHLAETSANEKVDNEVDESEQAEDEQPKKAPKPIQPRINELVRKQRDAEREAAYWRGVAQGKSPAPAAPSPQVQAPAPAAPARPAKESFASYDEYVEAISDWKADIKVQEALTKVNETIEKRDATKSAAQQQQSRAKNWVERAAATREILKDFDDVLSAAEGAKIEEHTAELLEDSPHGPAIAYKLAKDPSLLERLNNLSPRDAAKEFGKIEAVFDGSAPNTAPVPNPASKAPKPPSSVQVRSAATRDLGKMSMDEYVANRKVIGLR